MSPESASQLRPWSASRWCGLILLVLSLQLGLIFWLSDRTPQRPHPQAQVPVLRPAGALPAEFLALSDPTWFALPHPQGLSGRAWMQVPEPQPHYFNWTSPPAWLLLPQEPPGAAFYAFVRSNDFGAAVPAATSELVLTLPEPTPVPLAGERSELRLAGALAQRALVTRVELTNRLSADLLTNSVVQAVVDAKGWPQTVTLLTGSSLATRDQVDADREALARAAVLRFASLPDGDKAAPALLTEGLLVFVWHTVPEPSTNATSPSQP
jgi:hypothetical protein